MDLIFQLLLSTGFIIPFLLIFSAGIMLSIINRKKMGKAATFALIGFIFLLINSLLDIIHLCWLILYANQISAQSVSTIMFVKGIAGAIFGIAGFIFLLAAIFVKRDYSNPD